MKGKKSAAWKAAECDYSELHIMRDMPFLGESLSPEQVMERLAVIVKSCPQFYPAVLELGGRRLAQGAGETEVKRILKGLQLMLELGDSQHLDAEVDALISNLENAWRFDVAERCLERLVEHDPQNPLFRDYLAHSMARLGKIDQALEQSLQAVAMAPRNAFFQSNLGLFYLMKGDAAQARTHLKAARKRDPQNESAKENLEMAEYLLRHGGDLASYLLRPVDRDRMERLEEEEEFEELQSLCNSYNGDRMLAFGTELARDKTHRCRCADTLSTLRNFFDFVDQVANELGFLNEDIAFVHKHFTAIMHKFIFKFRDVDRQMIHEICQGLVEFYRFLVPSGLVSPTEFVGFQTLVEDQREALIDKMLQYNAIRHDSEMTPDQKEAIRQKLFAGDHAWPHL